ncbi:Uncharacterised protein [Sphingobacterium multivorum]|uniref:hypothetical protein n=1 Tax=Sphingobacterium multivorum TaxID=28454 RepID=UPI000E083F0F|nr:hypothetical protein [Sphingobacterium multivorum]QQT43362.1 hypothetical protein I6J00_16585 [Sphingobacterium multivorum]SUI98456.1 Uncharacterised protein [Sphingobacterium multivorum]
MVKNIYHTLEFRNNNDELLETGPIHCNRSDAWLAPGYYFWEESMKAAHYWGTNRLKKDYVIFHAHCYIDETNCFDLVGSVPHRDEFHLLYCRLVDAGLISKDSTVGHVIDFLQKANSFDYPSSRIESTDAFIYYVEDSEETTELLLDKRLTVVTLKLNLVIQICIYDLEAVLFDSFKLVHDSTDPALYSA